MRILIADDESVSRLALQAALEHAGHDVVVATDGVQAWDQLRAPGAPRLAVIDWMMPRMDGMELCRAIRGRVDAPYIYVVMLTTREGKSHVVAGLEAGADDYLTKPFDEAELLWRLRVGERVLNLEAALARKVTDLELAFAHVRKLQGLLPICMHCKRIRDDRDVWHQLELYIEEHSGAMFTHSLCGECRKQHYPRKTDEKAA